ncbi:hypothetical protein Pelo_1476 [Pelomyxa schiedti]|nr:hypothetical protein Pelo_1476 [Pelomyxa schiedti]
MVSVDKARLLLIVAFVNSALLLSLGWWWFYSTPGVSSQGQGQGRGPPPLRQDQSSTPPAPPPPHESPQESKGGGPAAASSGGAGEVAEEPPGPVEDEDPWGTFWLNETWATDEERVDSTVQQLLSAPRDVLLVHCMWSSRGAAMNKLSTLAPKAVIATNPPDRAGRVRLVVWLDASDGTYKYPWWEKHPNLAPIRGLGVVLPCNVTYLAQGTPMENYVGMVKNVSRLAFKSDIIRILILYKFGGAWFDNDALFLREITPLTDEVKNFAYWWKRPTRISNGFIRVEKNSPVVNDMMARMIKERSAHPSLGWTAFQNATKHPDFKIVSIKLLDPGWIRCCGFSFKWFFLNTTYEDMRKVIGNAYIYHWHNLWKSVPEPYSPYIYFETRVENAIQTRTKYQWDWI